jgi:hypothetical protein
MLTGAMLVSVYAAVSNSSVFQANVHVSIAVLIYYDSMSIEVARIRFEMAMLFSARKNHAQ